MSARPARRLLPFAALAAATGLVLSACAAPTGQSEGDAELVWSIEGANLSAGHMDPQVSQLDVSGMVQRAVLDSLVFQEKDGSFSPWLAEEWEVSDDSTEYTFTLRDDVTFTDGEPFDAAAVKANFDRIVDPETASAQAASMLGADFYDGTEVVDDHTVKVTFTQPYAPFLQAASTPQLGFYSPAVLEESADQLKAGGPGITVGTGPFELTEYTPDQELVYTRNDDYTWGPHDAKAPKFETLRVEIQPEAAVRTGVIESGEADIASNIPPNLAKDLGDGITVDSIEYPGLPYSLYLNEKYGVFADEKVRQAFARGIDVEPAVKEIFFGQFPRAWSVLGSTTPGYDADLEGTWAFDQDEANALLDDAGWTERNADGIRTKDGEPLSVRWIAWTPVPDDRAALANAIQSDLKAIGFEVVREVLEPGAYNAQYEPKTFDLTDWGFSGVDPDFLRSHLHSEGFQNASQVADPEIDALLEQAVASSDQDERNEIYTRLQEWNAKYTAIVPLYSPSAITAIGDRLDGLDYDLYGRPLFYDVTVG
ncbi:MULTISPECIES: ABC transporter substrate-binding protein [unclassified Microbacterium]|uniref:ABC transporter substrate-binding protein n=1 Tax=unclassified Microbacterium TaxID=2609290 RepID=UPI000EAA2CA0|nr:MULTISPECIES: ABC transporter substrate-binding protein [unclassified Microbacterium]MBT2486254.1 ABC transporter substrate-binding protein [Microbacterium sp. ISL-108]RKN68971.1 ABC transporter substrate-binding protein [Microbacterium sp. CGR2]